MLKPQPHVEPLPLADVARRMPEEGIDRPFEDVIEGVGIPDLTEAKATGDLELVETIRRDWLKANGNRQVLISWSEFDPVLPWSEARFVLQ